MANAVYDIEINGVGYSIINGSYQETGRAALLPRTMAETAMGDLDFGLGFPYPQRSWLLGEQQYYTHEYDELKSASLRRYQEGHGVDVSRDGRLCLLPRLSLSQVLGTNPTTCPMCASRTGSYVYAFPAGSTNMYIFNGTTWTTEAITGVTAPVLDCVSAGDEIWIIDSAASGSRVRKRSAGGSWSQVTVATSADAFGYSTAGATAVTLALDVIHVDKFAVPWACDISEVYVYLDGSGAGTGNQVCKAVIYSDDADTYYPDALLGTSAEVTVTDGQAIGWQKFEFSPAVSIAAAANVNIGIIGGANTNTIRIYKTTSSDYSHATMADTYAGGAADPFGAAATVTTDAYSIYAVVTRTSSGWPSAAYDDATAVIYTNGEHYVLTPDELYAHEANELCSQWQGGSIGCSYAGSVFWSDGSNRVYRYNGTGTQLIMEDLPTGFSVQSLFAAHSRLWVCGVLPNGDAGIYWYQQGQYGVGTYLESAVGSTRNIYAGAAATEHVIFADSRYTSIRHYAAEGGWSHYLEYTPGTALSGVTIPYKGLTVGAGHVVIALATGNASTQGIYADADTYVDSGWFISSQADLQMPAHSKAWSAMTVQCLPIRTGEKIAVQYSTDGGRLWSTAEYLSLPDATEEAFKMSGTSDTVQHKLTLYSPTGNATTPELLAVVMRGHPIVRAAKQWTFVVTGGEMAPTRNETKMLDNASRIQALIDLSDAAAPVTFRSLDGRTYTAVVRTYLWKPVWDSTKTKLSMSAQITLDQVEI